ncbi:MAG: hypothetical protein IH859_06250 [Chloroflexi bacterium]|nr:hypothetical protein [Chloroflexota bacterium]
MIGVTRFLKARALKVYSILLILTGVVWFLQGINILPGSFMTGQIEWAIAGVISAVIGFGLYARLKIE